MSQFRVLDSGGSNSVTARSERRASRFSGFHDQVHTGCVDGCVDGGGVMSQEPTIDR